MGAIYKHGGTIYKKGGAINLKIENGQLTKLPRQRNTYCEPLFKEIFKGAALSAWLSNNNLKENAKSWRRHPS
jgi:hypothetical protein